MSGNFYIVREDWLQFLNTPSEVLAYSYIATMCENTGECHASVQQISDKTKCKPRWLKTMLHDFETRGLLIIESRKGKNNCYKIAQKGCSECTSAVSAPVQIVHPTSAVSAPPSIIINNTYKTNIKPKRARVRAWELGFVSSEYVTTFEKWLAYKQERRQSYKSTNTMQAAYKRLLKLANNDAETADAIVEQSIANNWAGLFELKTNKQHGNNKQQEYASAVNTAIIAGLSAE